MYHSLFIHSSTEGHLGCLQILVIMNKTATNTSVQAFVQICFPLFEVNTQDHDFWLHNKNIFSFLRRASLVAQLVKNPSTVQETPVRFLDWEDPLKKGQATHSRVLTSILMWELNHKEGWEPTNWCFQTVVLGMTLVVPWTARRSN